MGIYHFLGRPPLDGREKLLKGAVDVPTLLPEGDANTQSSGMRHELILL
jgi:hypothetical protein